MFAKKIGGKMKFKFVTAFFLSLWSGMVFSDYKMIYKTEIKIPEVKVVNNESEVADLNPTGWYTSENIEVDGSGVVLKMEDITGNGYDADKLVGDITVVENELNGYPALYSKESTFYSNMDTRGFPAMTVFTVLKGEGSSRMLGVSNYDSSPSGGFKLFNDNVNGRPAGGAHLETDIYSGSEYVISTALVKDYMMSHYINGSLFSSKTIDGTFKVSQSGVAIFGRPFVNSSAYSHISSGYGVEVLIFNRELDEPELNEIHSYLKSKYSIN